jgi:hypothetical protein
LQPILVRGLSRDYATTLHYGDPPRRSRTTRERRHKVGDFTFAIISRKDGRNGSDFHRK